MYYKHFNLSGPPFQFTPSPEVLYPSKSHREALAALEWGLMHEPSGLTMLIGEPGTGKTTIIGAVLSRHFANVRTAYVGNPKLSFEEILSVISRQLGITSVTGGKLAMLDAIDRRLEAGTARDRVTAIIDESQDISDEVLEELRLLSNFAPNRSTGLRFVFVGQPEFLHRLATPALRQLNERIGARALLNPLQLDEIREYIDYRLRARGSDISSVFTSGALRHIIEHSAGIPRRINVLCHNAMLLAYSATSSRVRASHAVAAATEYDDLFSVSRTSETTKNRFFRRPFFTRSFLPRLRTYPQLREALQSRRALLAIGAIGALLAGVVYAFSGNPHPREYIPTAASAGDAVRLANATVAKAAAAAHIDLPGPTPIIYPPHSPAASPTADFAGLANKKSGGSSAHLRQITVQNGDTVAILARRYLGSDDKVEDLIEANPQLADVNRIFPGDVINVPETPESVVEEK